MGTYHFFDLAEQKDLRMKVIPSSRQAFTLVELLVVIAIIGSIMGLLLPAVQSAREAGRRNTCQSNVAQLGKATTQHDLQQGYLPSWRDSNGASAGLNGRPWPVALLPNLERSDVYRDIESGGSPSIQLGIFLCPTSPPDGDGALIAYSANGGTAYANNAGSQFKGDGVFLSAMTEQIGVGGGGAPSVQGARTNLDVISGKDGTSTTLLYAEKNAAGNANAFARIVPQSPAELMNPWTSAKPLFGMPGNQASYTVPMINNETAAGLPTSNHSGGVCVVFCDGHTIFMNDTIAKQVYAQLLTSNSKWNATNSNYQDTNSSRADGWLQSNGGKYTLNEADFNAF